MEETKSLEIEARGVLDQNYRGDHTIPAPGLYPHQWLWDSCFIAIGLRHYDIDRAQLELHSLIKGQWDNGMLPHIVFSESNGINDDYYAEKVWKSSRSPHAPNEPKTSGITQPPMLAEAVVKVGEKLEAVDRLSWYEEMFAPLVKHHEWLYDERDPRSEGLVTVVHPWESGMDNTPPWMAQLKRSHPLWMEGVTQLSLEKVLGDSRENLDGKHVPVNQRLSDFEMDMVFYAAEVLARDRYDSAEIIENNPFVLQDLAFNAILVRANSHLESIANELGKELPPKLIHSIDKASNALEILWDPEKNQYFSRIFETGQLVQESTVANFLPLYSKLLKPGRAAELVDQMQDENSYETPFPLPTVPLNSEYFDPNRYWQGPTWINMNWLITQGLRENGYHEEAKTLGKHTLNLVENSGFYEYFNPDTGRGVGVSPFSWTAALVIDLLHDTN